MWKSRVESVSVAHLKISVPVKRKKDYSSFKAKQSSSINFCRSHKLIAARVGVKLAEIYRGGDADSRSPLPLFHKNISPALLLFRTSVQTKGGTAELSVLQKKLCPNCVRRLQVAAPLSEPPLRSFERKSGKKKGKSDTLVELGVSVCQSVKCVRGEKPTARTHTPSLPL